MWIIYPWKYIQTLLNHLSATLSCTMDRKFSWFLLNRFYYLQILNPKGRILIKLKRIALVNKSTKFHKTMGSYLANQNWWHDSPWKEWEALCGKNMPVTAQMESNFGLRQDLHMLIPQKIVIFNMLTHDNNLQDILL